MIFLFKTSVQTPTEVKRLSAQLDELPATSQWSFDLDDCDHVLRIDSLMEIKHFVISLLREHGFYCDELID